MAHPALIAIEESESIPSGWYTVAISSDLGIGDILPFRLADIHFVAYRGESGKVLVVEDRCPHLGGAFKKGSVVGDSIRCPVHGFTFDSQGECVSTGFEKVTAKACVHQWPVLDINGLILVYYHPDNKEPQWQPEVIDSTGWSEMQVKTTVFPSTPQLVTEGIADKGHLATVHGYHDISMDSDFATEAHRLTTAYSFTNTGSFPGAGRLQQWLGKLFSSQLRVEFHYQASGLGYAFTEVVIPKLEVRIRTFVNPTPVTDKEVKLFYTMQMAPITRPEKIHPLMKRLPSSVVEKIMIKSLLKGFQHDVEDDIAIWSSMKPVSQPRLCKADGPIYKYRKWSRQFYS